MLLSCTGQMKLGVCSDFIQVGPVRMNSNYSCSKKILCVWHSTDFCQWLLWGVKQARRKSSTCCCKGKVQAVQPGHCVTSQ